MRVTAKPERDSERYQKILGIDSSTLGVAYTQIESGQPLYSGMIKMAHIKDMQAKLEELSVGLTYLLDCMQPDHIFIEMPIFVKNPDTARKLSFVVGAIMTVAAQKGYKTTLVEPATWKSFTKYKNISRKMSASAVEKLGKTEGKKFCDRLRKEQTSRALQQSFPEWEFDYSDDNIVDSCAIALYGYHLLSKEIIFPSNLILFNQSELDILGSPYSKAARDG